MKGQRTEDSESTSEAALFTSLTLKTHKHSSLFAYCPARNVLHNNLVHVYLDTNRLLGCCVCHLLEGLQVLQGLLGCQSQAGLHAGGEPADTSLQVWIKQRGAQQEQHLLLQQDRLQETQRVETHLPVSICHKYRDHR